MFTSARRLAALTVPALVAVAAVVVPSSPAQAEGYCSISVPTHIVVDRPYKRITAHLGSDCSEANVEWASWDLYHSREGWSGIFLFDGSSSDSWDLYDYDTLGTYTAEADSAYDYDYNDVYQSDETIYVRLGTKLSTKIWRSGGKVKFQSKVWRYSPSAERYVVWKNKAVYLSTASSTSGTWKTLKVLKTDRNGVINYSYAKSTKRYYRAAIGGSSTVWGRTSVAVRR